MKFFFTLFGLIIGAGVGSFWAAMVFGASGWALAHWLDKMQSEGKDLPEPEPSPLRPDLARSIAQPTSVEDQLRALQARVEVLEERLGVRAPAP
jgi:TolA-binding protein